MSYLHGRRTKARFPGNFEAKGSSIPEITVGMVGVRRVVREAGVVGLELRLKARMHPGALARCLFSFKVEAG